jgi:hypothetical protein
MGTQNKLFSHIIHITLYCPVLKYFSWFSTDFSQFVHSIGFYSSAFFVNLVAFILYTCCLKLNSQFHQQYWKLLICLECVFHWWPTFVIPDKADRILLCALLLDFWSSLFSSVASQSYSRGPLPFIISVHFADLSYLCYNFILANCNVSVICYMFQQALNIWSNIFNMDMCRRFLS